MERIFNLWEAGLWFLIAVTLLLRARREHGPRRRTLFGLCAVIIPFGISDLIEARTGAWWEPWWLAVVKVGCGVAIGLGFWRYYAHREKPAKKAHPESR